MVSDVAYILVYLGEFHVTPGIIEYTMCTILRFSYKTKVSWSLSIGYDSKLLSELKSVWEDLSGFAI